MNAGQVKWERLLNEGDHVLASWLHGGLAKSIQFDVGYIVDEVGFTS